MRQTMFILIIILNLFLFVFSEKVTLKCGVSRTKDDCQCDIKIDPTTNLTITEAICEYLELKEFPILDSLEPMDSLDLSHNSIQSLTGNNPVSPQFVEIISTLKFCHNSINDIEENFISSFPNLTTLDLSHNNLTTLSSKSLFDELAKLEVLDLSFNYLKTLPDGVFEALQNLNNLNMSYNPLYKVFQNPTALMDNLKINENILYLSLDNAGVTRIHAKCWNSFKNILYLSVADNPISEIPQTSSTLRYLDISGTNISDLHENLLKYPNLKVLKMSRMNYLSSIPHYSLYNLGKLEEFIMTDSPRVNDFNEFTFGLLDRKMFPRELRKFDLARNRLSKLNESYKFIFQEMEFVDVSFNPWNCDCDLLWMKKLDAPMRRRSDMRCASPKGMVNKLVLQLQPKDVPNCHPEIYGKKGHQTAILVLLILIFALIVVITYLCLYSPSWSIKLTRTKLSTSVAPDSPYSINNDQM